VTLAAGSADAPVKRAIQAGPVFATTRHVVWNLNRMTMPIEVLVGRTLAMCAHPYAAWRAHSLRGRLLVLFSYVAASYAVMLAILLLSF
jgi:hypothetical protein